MYYVWLFLPCFEYLFFFFCDEVTKTWNMIIFHSLVIPIIRYPNWLVLFQQTDSASEKKLLCKSSLGKWCVEFSTTVWNFPPTRTQRKPLNSLSETPLIQTFFYQHAEKSLYYSFNNSPCFALHTNYYPGDLPYECTFEVDTCGLRQRTEDNFDWLLRSEGSTTTDQTGPTSGYQNSRYYMFIEASSPRVPGDRAQ